MRHLLALLAASVLATLSPSLAPPSQADYCPTYPTQAEAQAAYRADPHGLAALDRDQDGLACESNSAPFDCELVPADLRRGPLPTRAPRLPRACSGS